MQSTHEQLLVRSHTMHARSSRVARTSWALVAVCVFALGALAACDSADDDELPTVEALVGLWVNEDAGAVRAFEFAAEARYTLYFYAARSEPTVNQRGTYAITQGQLVTHVTNAPVDPALAGKTFGNTLLDWSGGSFTVTSDSAASGRRTFTRSDTLP